MGTSDKYIKVCDYCGEEISSFSTRCAYCGSIFDEKTKKYSIPNSKKFAVTSTYITDPVDIQKPLKIIEENKSDEYYSDNKYKPQSGQILKEQKDNGRKSLKNSKKVFITTICTLLPGFGQLAGVIIGILLINIEDDPDRNSFGRSLLISSIFVFIISSFAYFFITLAFLSQRLY